MIQQQFAERAAKVLGDEENVSGLAAAGSWITGEVDEFSDLDLVLVTKEKVGGNPQAMHDLAKKLGTLINGFTGEHVGEPRLLICLYDEPLLHVDIKFVTEEEFATRVETPVILLDKENVLQQKIDGSTAQFPHPDPQWIEDRFWTWIHYALLKIGRGEYMEAFDFLGYLRGTVLGPLALISEGHLPRGVRKVETTLSSSLLKKLQSTTGAYDRRALLTSLQNAVLLYNELRYQPFSEKVDRNIVAEQKVMEYFSEIEKRGE